MNWQQTHRCQQCPLQSTKQCYSIIYFLLFFLLTPWLPPRRPSHPLLHPTIYEDKTGIVLKSTFSSELPGFGYSFTSKGERHACHPLQFNSPPSGRTRRLAQRAASKQGQKQSPGQCKTWRRSAPRMRYLLQGWLWNIARSKSDHFLDSSYGVFVYTGTGWEGDETVAQPLSGIIYSSLEKQHGGCGLQLTAGPVLSPDVYLGFFL